MLASIEFKSTFIKEINDGQFKDEDLNELKEKMVIRKAQETTLVRMVHLW